MKLVISSLAPTRYLASGEVFFGLGDADELRRVIVASMTPEQVAHTLARL